MSGVLKLFILRNASNAKNAKSPLLGYAAATRPGAESAGNTKPLESKKRLHIQGPSKVNGGTLFSAQNRPASELLPGATFASGNRYALDELLVITNDERRYHSHSGGGKPTSNRQRSSSTMGNLDSNETSSRPSHFDSIFVFLSRTSTEQLSLALPD